jgi:hypothetical protein
MRKNYHSNGGTEERGACNRIRTTAQHPKEIKHNVKDKTTQADKISNASSLSPISINLKN